jgi:segregation and condensation protein B
LSSVCGSSCAAETDRLCYNLFAMTDALEPVAPQPPIKNPSSEIGLPYPLPVMVESLLFVASEPVPVTQIAEALEVKLAEVEQALAELNAAIVARGVRVQRKGDKVQLTTQPECAPYIEKFLGLDLTTRLSKPALETLAIIAYQQPVTRAQIEHVRGVNCDAVLATLLNRGLIEELGRLETAGRPIQYGTTFAFLQHFGLRGLEDMPSLQPEEAAALGALAEQGQAIAVDLAAPTDRVEGETAVPVPDQSVAPIETQLSLLGEEAPSAEYADAVAAEVDTSAPPEMLAAEMTEADRVGEETAAIELAPDQPETAIEPQSAEEDSSNENAAI